MQKSRRLIILSHCILNSNSKVEAPVLNKGLIKELLTLLMDNDIGIIQLPCPELHHYGMKRWGHVKEQFDNPFYKNTFSNILKPIIMEIEEYISNNYDVIGVVGIDGSPSCGVNKTCKSSDYIGELSNHLSLDLINDSVYLADEPGVFMEIFMSQLSFKFPNLPFIGIDETNIDASLDNLKKYIC